MFTMESEEKAEPLQFEEEPAQTLETPALDILEATPNFGTIKLSEDEEDH